jgi:hypothetical protein
MLRPETVDPTMLEKYLSDEDFFKVFGCTKEEFARKPAWKQMEMKKAAGLH